MATLLLKLQGLKAFNRTFFAPYLYVYDDLLLYKKGRLFGSREITVSYNHIVQVNLTKGLFLSTIEIINTGAENINVKYVLNTPARRAKQIIDQKIFHVHRKKHLQDTHQSHTYHNLEKSLNRLKELMQRGKISKVEYNRKRKRLLKKIGHE